MGNTHPLKLPVSQRSTANTIVHTSDYICNLFEKASDEYNCEHSSSQSHLTYNSEQRRAGRALDALPKYNGSLLTKRNWNQPQNIPVVHLSACTLCVI